MSAEAINNALARMEAALTRIEQAAARPAAGDAGLAARHERLRATVGDSLREIDALLAEGGE